MDALVLQRVTTAPPPRFAGGFLPGVANPQAYLAIGVVFAGAPALSPPLRLTVLGQSPWSSI